MSQRAHSQTLNIEPKVISKKKGKSKVVKKKVIKKKVEHEKPPVLEKVVVSKRKEEEEKEMSSDEEEEERITVVKKRRPKVHTMAKKSVKEAQKCYKRLFDGKKSLNAFINRLLRTAVDEVIPKDESNRDYQITANARQVIRDQIEEKIRRDFILGSKALIYKESKTYNEATLKFSKDMATAAQKDNMRYT
tara:strand:- start:731 stop:1303 length:573 start_codon:yes stop_codon:yes gene_type:complete